MKRIAILGVLALTAGWDGPGLWYATATGGASGTSPGGGGILGTGGQHDHGIKCTDCHVDRVDEPALALAFDFNPPLAGDTYVPNQAYAVTATLTGAQLGRSCGTPGGGNTDNFAAAFESDDGALAGRLTPDDGQSPASCALPSPPPQGTTALDGDCRVIFSSGGRDRDTWTFSWTAPASGDVHIYYGAVDGDCDMMSMGDAAVTGSRTLTPAAAVRAPWSTRFAIAFAALVLGSH